MKINKTKEHGFTLVEIALVLVIAGVVLATLSSVLLIYIKNTNIKTTEQRLEQIQDSMQLFVEFNGRLPCPAPLTLAPDDTDFGREVSTNDCNGGAFAGTFTTGTDGVRIGAVPTRALNLPDDFTLDGWNNRFTYAVTQVMAEAGTYEIDAGIIDIQDSGGNSVTVPDASAHYVIVSHGPDGAGAYSASGTAGVPCGTGTLDAQNCDNADEIFARTILTSTAAGANFYDDLVVFRASGDEIGTPAGAVMPFNLFNCPPGWAPYTLDPGDDPLDGLIYCEKS